jgi:hypothetical protein
METFFSRLAERLNSENDLSDMTWALCSSNDAFQKTFLEYCFDCSIKNDIDYIEREFVEDKTRPDFLIFDTAKKRYLLEVKKKDKNLHDDYKKIKNITSRAFIANYPLPENNKVYDYKKTWHGLIEHIEKQKENINGLDSPIIRGYLNYIKSVTNYFKGESMNLSNLHSLRCFLKTIKQIIESSNIDNVKPKYAGWEEWSGYEFKFKKPNKYFHVWFGITFGNKESKESYVYLEFFDDCSKSIKETLKGTNKGKYFKKPYQEDERIFVDIENKYLKMLCDNEKDYDEQKDSLEKFFKEVMDLF